MKRKIVVSLLAMCMVTGMFTGCGSQQQAQESVQTVEQQKATVETLFRYDQCGRERCS